jgi:hypothetical protein
VKRNVEVGISSRCISNFLPSIMTKLSIINI